MSYGSGSTGAVAKPLSRKQPILAAPVVVGGELSRKNLSSAVPVFTVRNCPSREYRHEKVSLGACGHDALSVDTLSISAVTEYVPPKISIPIEPSVSSQAWLISIWVESNEKPSAHDVPGRLVIHVPSNGDVGGDPSSPPSPHPTTTSKATAPIVFSMRRVSITSTPQSTPSRNISQGLGNA